MNLPIYIFSFIVTLLFTLVLSVSSVSAADIAGSKVSIRFSGNVADNTAKRIKVSDIEKVGLQQIKAFNPYEKKTDEYSGIWLNDLVQKFAKAGTTQITFSAIDDYKIEFYEHEWTKVRILLATKVNGEYIGYKNKGPMRIVFPDYQADEKFYQKTMPKWMWMINKVNFK